MPVVASEELTILRIASVVMDLKRIEVIRNVRDRYGWSEGVFGIKLDVLGDAHIRGKVGGKAGAPGLHILDVILIDVDGLIGEAASQLDLRVYLDLPWERHTAPCQEPVRNISCSIGIQIGADERRGKIAQVGIGFIERALGQAPDIGGIKLVVALKRNLCRQFKLTTPGELVEKPSLTQSIRTRWGTKLLFGAAFLVLAIVPVLWYAIGSTTTPLKKFWSPIASAEGAALVCVSVQDDYPPNGQPTALENKNSELLSYQKDRWVNRLGLADATALAQMAGVLYSRGKDYQVAAAQSVGLNQLRHGPVILIGAFNNDWTLRMTRDLRFGFSNDQKTGQHWIVDRVRHNRLDLEINSKTPYKNIVVDYGLVGRFNDPVCGCTVVIASGLGEYGTIAAGEFLSHDEYFRKILDRAPKRWEKMNMEIVIATKVVNGDSGPPYVVDTHFW